MTLPSLIYLGVLHKATWTPKNNYGQKEANYTECSTFPVNLFINGIKTVRDEYDNGIFGLWFQEGHHLEKFHPINKKLISTKILNLLKNK